MTNTQQLPPLSWCQSIGAVGAKQAAGLIAGEHIVYNYGETAKVISVSVVSVNMVEVETESRDGRRYSRRYKKMRLVPVHELGYYPTVRKDEVR